VSYRPDLRGVTERLLTSYRPGDVVAYDDVFDFLPALWYAHQMAGQGTSKTSAPYTFVPLSWVRQAPLRQVLLGSWQMKDDWLPHGPGRVWMVSTIGVLHRGQAPRVAPWFHPPGAGWKLADEDTHFYRLLIRLYVRR
jgi:hypothetical protein